MCCQLQISVKISDKKQTDATHKQTKISYRCAGIKVSVSGMEATAAISDFFPAKCTVGLPGKNLRLMAN
jgi:hypothetical protein